MSNIRFRIVEYKQGNDKRYQIQRLRRFLWWSWWSFAFDYCQPNLAEAERQVERALAEIATTQVVVGEYSLAEYLAKDISKSLPFKSKETG